MKDHEWMNYTAGLMMTAKEGCAKIKEGGGVKEMVQEKGEDGENRVIL